MEIYDSGVNTQSEIIEDEERKTGYNTDLIISGKLSGEYITEISLR